MCWGTQYSAESSFEMAISPELGASPEFRVTLNWGPLLNSPGPTE